MHCSTGVARARGVPCVRFIQESPYSYAAQTLFCFQRVAIAIQSVPTKPTIETNGINVSAGVVARSAYTAIRGMVLPTRFLGAVDMGLGLRGALAKTQRVALWVRLRSRGFADDASVGSTGTGQGSQSEEREPRRRAGRSTLLAGLEQQQRERAQPTAKETGLPLNGTGRDTTRTEPSHAALYTAKGAGALQRRVSRSLLGLAEVAEKVRSTARSATDTSAVSVDLDESSTQVRRPWRQRKSRLLEAVSDGRESARRAPRTKRQVADSESEAMDMSPRRMARASRLLEIRPPQLSVSLLPPSVREEQARVASSLLEREGPAAVEKVRMYEEGLHSRLEADVRRQRRRQLGKFLVFKNRYLPESVFKMDRYKTEDLWVNHAVRIAENIVSEAKNRQSPQTDAAAKTSLWLESVVADLFPKARRAQEIMLMIRLLRKSMEDVQRLPPETRQAILNGKQRLTQDALKQLGAK